MKKKCLYIFILVFAFAISANTINSAIQSYCKFTLVDDKIEKEINDENEPFEEKEVEKKIDKLFVQNLAQFFFFEAKIITYHYPQINCSLYYTIQEKEINPPELA
jgi:hypothetical protein